MVKKEIEELTRLKALLSSPKTNTVDFSKYCKIYPYTNENLYLILKGEDGTNKKALTVLSSGDQLYDLVLKNFKNIDTFDINSFTKHYALGLKKCAIEQFDYNEFCSYFSIDGKIGINIIKYLMDFMDLDDQVFWKEYINLISNNSNDLFIKSFKQNTYISNIDYLTSKAKYSQMKLNLLSTQINFDNCDISDLTKKKDKYDLIYLSNICDYLSNKENKTIIKELYSNNLKKHGEIYVVGTWSISDIMDKKSLKFNTDDWCFTKIYKENPFHIKDAKVRERKLYREQK